MVYKNIKKVILPFHRVQQEGKGFKFMFKFAFFLQPSGRWNVSTQQIDYFFMFTYKHIFLSNFSPTLSKVQYLNQKQ